eukprot:scaffold32784_cov23-Tisochrysis_lutea.AAC.1
MYTYGGFSSPVAGIFTDSRLSLDAESGMHRTRACLIHNAWSAYPMWDITQSGLPAVINDVDCVPYLPGGALHGDPHLTLAHGGEADFRGCDGCLFNFLNTDDLVVNARTKDATFTLDNATVHGSFLDEVHLAWRAPCDGWLNLSYWGEEVGPGNWGWKVINGTCSGGRFHMFLRKTFGARR